MKTWVGVLLSVAAAFVLFFAGVCAFGIFVSGIEQESERATKEANQEAVNHEWAAKQAALAKAWGTWVVRGRIIQKLYDGLLVQSEGGFLEISEQQNIYSNPAKPIPIYEGTCLLLDHPHEQAKVDGDSVCIRVNYNGQFSYQTVLGSRKTVRQFRAVAARSQ